MKNTSLYITLSLVACILAVRCAKPHGHEIPVYQRYEMSCDLDDNSATASASFRMLSDSGTYVLLRDSIALKANGLVKNAFLPAAGAYASSWTFAAISDIQFTFLKNGRIFTNTMRPADAGEIGFSAANDTSFPRDKDIVLHWTGTPLTSQDAVVVSLLQRTSYGNYLIGGGAEGDSVVIGKNFAALMNAGPCEAIITRTHKSPLDNADDGASGVKEVSIKRHRNIILR